MSVLYCSSLFGASFAASCKVSDVVVFVTAQKDQLVAEVEGVRRTSIGVLPVMRKSTRLCRGLGPVARLGPAKRAGASPTAYTTRGTRARISEITS